jgi:hypothetical protein
MTYVPYLEDFARVRQAEAEERLAREESAPPRGSGEKLTVQFNMAAIAPYDDIGESQAKPGKQRKLTCHVMTCVTNLFSCKRRKWLKQHIQDLFDEVLYL